MSSVQPVTMRSAVFRIVCSTVMFVVDTIGDHIMEAYTLVLVFLRLCILRVMSLYVCLTWPMRELSTRI